MLRFAAAVLAVAAITPTPAEKGLARLSEALASPAVVNNDVLWTRCGALDKMAPHSTMQLHSHSVKCQDGQTGATASDRRSRFDRAESVAAAGTADAAVVNHCFIQIGTVHFKHSGVPEYATIFDPSRPCSLLSDDRALHTGDSRPQEVEAGDLRPLVAGAVDHALKQLLYPPAPHQWRAASGRDSPGLSDKDGDGAGELSTHWA